MYNPWLVSLEKEEKQKEREEEGGKRKEGEEEVFQDESKVLYNQAR